MKYFIYILGFLFVMGCNHDYYYLSENDKNYLFYEVGDKLMFIKETDTVYGEVSSKEFYLTSTGVFGTDHFEVGTLHIKNSFDSIYWIANIDVINYYGEAYYDIVLDTYGLFSQVDSCYEPVVEFSAKIRGNKLFECKNDTCCNINMVPVKSDIYKFNFLHQICPENKKSILKLSKSKGLTLFMLDEAEDSVIIKRL
jgi:hypothetical protein